ncbi:glycoside hydrolase family 13 protein [Bergeyella sp. RCAD1439]|uniref:glycoside hydrolase family 13 protein n=1 Tax=Bergeyella anatis TaxID=3113737 RepID=UPI002E193CD2|nr:glycoside hydrolase family 13 protein [Bergeyella sp. RCAD1439]
MKRSVLWFLFLGLMVSGGLSAQFKKVEPAFWWKGMKNPRVQILLYGDGIARGTLAFSDGVKPVSVEKVENPNYLFVTIDTREVPGSGFEIYLQNGKKRLASYRYELKDRQPHSAQRPSFGAKDAVYLIMPDRFANGDVSNDSQPSLREKADRTLPSGRHGGDLRGIINRLDYLRELGVTVLWLTPVNQDDEKSYSYHGYAQTDLYRIDARYGTNEDYLELSRELKKRGMLLIQDYVTNHWGISHWLIQDLPSKDWIHRFPDGEGSFGFKRSNYRTTTQFDANAALVDRREALNGWFDTTMPDLNQSHPLVLNYLIQNAIWWIEYAELGGLRVDTYPYNDKEAMAKWAKAITEEYPHLNIVGEAWMYSPAHISFWQKASKIGAMKGYDSHLPSVMDFTLFADLPLALQEEERWDRGLVRLYNVFSSDFLYPDIGNVMVFFENHDTERWNEIFDGDVRYYKLAMALISTVRGYPQLYYGSEVGLRGSKARGGDADIRRDFPGGWPGDAQNAFEAEGRTAEQTLFYDYTAALLNWRKGKNVIHTGKTKHYVPQGNVYVYFRYDDQEKVMVVLNTNDTETVLDLKRFEESLGGVTQGFDPIEKKFYEVSSQGRLVLPAKSPLILELK